jgi:hypothetical protein
VTGALFSLRVELFADLGYLEMGASGVKLDRPDLVDQGEIV